MDLTDHGILATDKFIKVVTKSLYDAVGDDIKEDVKSQELVTQNSTPSRIWDLINRNICKQFNKGDVIANPTKRGAWELVPIFERETGIIYSIMREQRYEALKKTLPKRRSAHYVDAFVRSLNADLRAPGRQISLIHTEPINFNNEVFIPDIIQKIISDLGVPNEVVKRHALILFQTFNGELSSVRCCIVDCNLDIVAEANWSNYIHTSESVVVEDANDKSSQFVDPAAGLKYKQKAKDKMGQKKIATEKSTDKESHDIS